MFDLVEMNTPFDDGGSAMQIYHQMFVKFLASIEDKVRIGDEIEFPDLDGRLATFEKKFPKKGN